MPSLALPVKEPPLSYLSIPMVFSRALVIIRDEFYLSVVWLVFSLSVVVGILLVLLAQHPKQCLAHSQYPVNRIWA